MKKSAVAFVITSLGAVTGLSAKPKSEPSRPNILFILADDLGYGDVSCFGSKLTPTPNIDQIASEGVRVTNAYVNPLSAPTRLGLMTGRYIQRLGGYTNQSSHFAKIPDTDLLLPQMLHQAGYKTGHIGKWNVNRPSSEVFDTVFHEIDWESDYIVGADGLVRGAETNDVDSNKKWSWTKQQGDKYITNVLADDAISFIRDNSGKEKPFFLYLAFNAVHSPLQAPIEFRDKYANLDSEALKLYAAMIHSMDLNIGRVMEQLKASGVDKNTLVVFLSDNGPAFGNFKGFPENEKPIQLYSAGVHSGGKGTLNEGGIKVPCIMRWPAVLGVNKTYTQPVYLYDMYATFHALSKSDTKCSSDGVNVIPYLSGKMKGAPHTDLFWAGGVTADDNSNPNKTSAIRSGDWKMIIDQSGNKRLYLLKADPAEKNDLSAQYPAMVKKLTNKFASWQKVVSGK